MRPTDAVLVVVFLRGGADGLNVVVPFGEDAYYDLRPTLAVARPDDRSADDGSRAIDLDGFFGLHPSLSTLEEVWHDGHLAVVHACGAPDESRSHFRSMDLMERGIGNGSGPPSGWLSRYLALHETNSSSPVRAVGLGESVPLALRGPVPASSVRSTDAFRLAPYSPTAERMERVLSRLYSGDDLLASSGQSSLAAVRALSNLDPENYRPTGGASYPDSEFGRQLELLAMLVKADVGLEAAAVDLGGWDTHFAQGSTGTGLMPGLLSDLGDGLGALRNDLSEDFDRLTVVVMTEFGRRAGENASLGTDHGHGSTMLVIGGDVAGGKVYGRWPGLDDGSLVGPGDLAVTTDYRDVLSEVCSGGAAMVSIAPVFPDYSPRAVGLMR